MTAATTAPRGGDVTSAKVVLLGDSAVGKSSLALRFARNEFHTNQETTIGAAFLSRTVQVPTTTAAAAAPAAASAANNNKATTTTTTRAVKLEIWDTAGQERYRSLAPIYYRGACGALVVYDITSRDSLDKARSWLHELRANADASLVVVLVGNKADLDAAARQVTLAEAQAVASAEGVAAVYETSAKDGSNVEAAFATLASKMVEHGVGGGRDSRGAAAAGAAGSGGVRNARVLGSGAGAAGSHSPGADGNASAARSMCCA